MNYPTTGRGLVNRLRRIMTTPFLERRDRFGRDWPWQITNIMQMIREDHPDLVPEMTRIMVSCGPKTVDDLIPVTPSTGITR